MKVSVCIPAYERLDLFQRCLQSVLIQDFTDYEIIVSDDSSHLQISDYVKSLGNDKIKYYHNSIALGSPANWNNAVSKASGEYVKILHHDDYFTTPEALKTFIKELDSSGASFAFCYSRIIFKNKGSEFIHKQTNRQLRRIRRDPDFLFYRNVIGAPSAVCFKKINDINFDEDFKWLVDVDFYIRFLKKNPGFVCIKQPLITVVAGESGQITENVSRSRTTVVNENIRLFSKANIPIKRNSKLFFEELFRKYEITSFEALNRISQIPSSVKPFFNDVFAYMKRNRFIKKLEKRILTSRYNKQFFKLERF